MVTQGRVSLEAVGQVGKGRIDGVCIPRAQAQACCSQEQRVDTKAQCATPGSGRLANDHGSLAEEVYDQVAGFREALDVGSHCSHRLNGAVASQRYAGWAGPPGNEPRLLGHVTIVHPIGDVGERVCFTSGAKVFSNAFMSR